MPSFPRSQSRVSATGRTASFGRVSQSDIVTGVTGEDIQQFGNELHEKGERILKREGETKAIEQFAEFQRKELLRFNEEKVQASNNPEGFTERFLQQSEANFQEMTREAANSYYDNVMQGRFSGLTNSLTYSATSFEASQKVKNRKARYASAVGSYAGTVYDDPDQLPNIVNLAKGDAQAAAASGVFGAEGVELAGNAGKRIARSAVMGIVEKRPQDIDGYLTQHGLDKIFTDKELRSFRSNAAKNFKNIPKIKLVEKQMKLVSEKDQVVSLYTQGKLSLGAIDSMSELSEQEKETARTLAVGGQKTNKDPEKLADLIAKRKELLDREDLTVGENLSDLVAFQNEVYNALGTDINNTEAKTLLKGTTDGINQAMEQKPETIGARFVAFGQPLFGKRKLSPEEKAIIAIDRFAGDKDASEKRSLLRAVSGRIDTSNLDDFDDTELDDNGMTKRDQQINAIIHAEIKNKVSGLAARQGTPNRVLGKDGASSTVTTSPPTTKPDNKVKIPPERTFATVEDAEKSGIKGLVIIDGRRARID